MRFATRFLRNSEGTTAVEYAVMLALIMAAAIAGITVFGQGGNGLWTNIMTEWNLYIGN